VLNFIYSSLKFLLLWLRNPRCCSVNPKELLELSQDVYLHHQALGNASPLLAMEAPNWETMGLTVSPAMDLDRRAKELEKELRNIYQKRDLLLGVIVLL